MKSTSHYPGVSAGGSGWTLGWRNIQLGICPVTVNEVGYDTPLVGAGAVAGPRSMVVKYELLKETQRGDVMHGVSPEGEPFHGLCCGA